MRRGPIAALPFLWIALLVQILAPASAALSMARALQTGAAGAPICGQRFFPPGSRSASASVPLRMSSADKSETPNAPLAPVDCARSVILFTRPARRRPLSRITLSCAPRRRAARAGARARTSSSAGDGATTHQRGRRPSASEASAPPGRSAGARISFRPKAHSHVEICILPAGGRMPAARRRARARSARPPCAAPAARRRRPLSGCAGRPYGGRRGGIASKHRLFRHNPPGYRLAGAAHQRHGAHA